MPKLVNAVPKAGNFVAAVGEQTDVDFALLLNMQSRGGILEPRPGWQVLQRNLGYTADLDLNTPDGFAWVDAGVESAVWEDNRPLGAFCFDSPDGESWILSLWYETGDYNTFRVTTTSGQTVASGNLDLVLFTGYDRIGLEPLEPSTEIYTFCRYYDTVFFANGGALWRWQPRTALRPYLCQAFHNGQNQGIGIYATGTIRGVKALAVHQGSLVLGGFERDSLLSLDAPVDVTGDGMVTSADATQVGGFYLQPNRQGVFLDPYTFMVSDTEQPLCFNIDNISQIGSHLGITALASANERLVIWTSGETFQALGPVADPLSSTVQVVSRGIGCVGPRAHAQTDAGWLMWLSDTGVFAWGDGGPKKISDQINELFDRGVAAFWRWQTVSDSTVDFAEISQLPTMALTTASPIASAVWIDRMDMLAIALSGACTSEPNNLILTWTPKDNRFALWTSRGAKSNWTLVTRGGSSYWDVQPPTPHSLMVGAVTLMVSANEPGLVIAQGQANDSANPTVTPWGSLCVLMGPGADTAIDVGETSEFLAMAISAPLFLGDDSTKLNTRIFLRMYAWRIKDFLTRFDEPADANPCWLFVMPETGHFDLATLDQTTTVCSAKSFSPWPDAFANRNYFWQWDQAPLVNKGAWGHVVGMDNRERRWLPLSIVDKRFDVPAQVGRWFRFAVAKVVDGRSDPALSLLSAGLEIDGDYGMRR